MSAACKSRISTPAVLRQRTFPAVQAIKDEVDLELLGQ